MSWSFTYAGNGKAVAEKVEKEGGTYTPQALKDFVKDIGSMVPEDRVLIVESNGHIESRQERDEANLVKPGTEQLVWGSGTLSFKIVPRAE